MPQFQCKNLRSEVLMVPSELCVAIWGFAIEVFNLKILHIVMIYNPENYQVLLNKLWLWTSHRMPAWCNCQKKIYGVPHLTAAMHSRTLVVHDRSSLRTKLAPKSWQLTLLTQVQTQISLCFLTVSSVLIPVTGKINIASILNIPLTQSRVAWSRCQSDSIPSNRMDPTPFPG